MERFSIPLCGLIVYLSFFYILPLSAQTSMEDKIKQEKIERNTRAIQGSVKDEYAYFEGFLLSRTYAEKQKLLKDIEETVSLVDKYAEQAEYATNPEVAEWRAKAHFLHGIALGVIGDKKEADYQMGIASEPISTEAEKAASFKEEEIQIGTINRKLADLEHIYERHLGDLASVQFIINSDKRLELGTSLKLRMKTKAETSHPEYIPFVLAHAENRLTQVLIKEARREIVYLPKGDYELIKPQAEKVICSFQVKDLDEMHSVSLPPGKFPHTYILIGVGAAALATLGYFIF